MPVEYEVTLTVKTNVPQPSEDFDGLDAINQAMEYGLRGLVKTGEYKLVTTSVVRMFVPEEVDEEEEEVDEEEEEIDVDEPVVDEPVDIGPIEPVEPEPADPEPVDVAAVLAQVDDVQEDSEPTGTGAPVGSGSIVMARRSHIN